MKTVFIIIMCSLFTPPIFGQYHFEKFPPLKYEVYEWQVIEAETAINHSVSLPNFFNKENALSLRLTYFTDTKKRSQIAIFKADTIQQFSVDIPFTPIGLAPLRVADFNGDGLKDIKISSFYMGSGLAALNIRIIYLFQKRDRNFVEISYDDMMEGNREERDLDNDGNFEIITMSFQGHKSHNYWLFNLYNFRDGKLVNVNQKFNYPQMVQLLFRQNFELTNKLSKDEMKKYELPLPNEYSVNH